MNSNVSGGHWYAVLSLGTAASEAEIAAAVELLSRRAAALAVTSPERSRELRDLTRSIKQDLLSGPEARQRYDHALAQQAATMVATPPPGSQPAPQSWPQPVQPGPPQPWPQSAQPGFQAGAGPASPPVRGSAIGRFLRSGWVCSSCGTNAMPSDKFCMKCGTKITAPGSVRPRAGGQATAAVARCANCGAVLAPGNSFCTNCGATRP